MKFSEPAGEFGFPQKMFARERLELAAHSRVQRIPAGVSRQRKADNGVNAAPDGSIVRKQIPADSEFELTTASVVVLCVRL
jgi:hypothetical protein